MEHDLHDIDDLPGGLASLLEAAGAFDDAADIDPARLTALLAALDEPTRARVLARFGTKAAAATAVLMLGSTAALASTGSLPDPAQNGLSRAMERVGVQLPRADKTDKADTHGQRVSEVARTTELTGRDKGQEIARVAREQGEAKRAERGDDEVEIDEPATVEAADDEGAGERPETHGQRVSEVARTTELTGRDKGQEISRVAREQGEAKRGGDANVDNGEQKGTSAGRPDHAGPPADSPSHTAPGRANRGG